MSKSDGIGGETGGWGWGGCSTSANSTSDNSTSASRPIGRSRNWPKSKLAEVEINWPKSNRWCLLCFFSLSFFSLSFSLLFFSFSLVLTHLTLSSFCFGSVSVFAQKPELNPEPEPSTPNCPMDPSTGPPSTGPTLHRTTLHLTTLHRTTLHQTTLHLTTLRRTTLRRTAQNFALFSPLLPPSLGGLFAEFWWCF